MLRNVTKLVYHFFLHGVISLQDAPSCHKHVKHQVQLRSSSPKSMTIVKGYCSFYCRLKKAKWTCLMSVKLKTNIAMFLISILCLVNTLYNQTFVYNVSCIYIHYKKKYVKHQITWGKTLTADSIFQDKIILAGLGIKRLRNVILTWYTGTSKPNMCSTPAIKGAASPT